MPSWLTKQKQIFTTRSQSNVDEVVIATFNSMQSLAYDVVKKHFDSPIRQSPLHLIINGVAGTGKSYLISAFKRLLQRSCVVSATTGKAAFSINGITIHSLLNLPVGPRGKKDLTGQSLARLQARLLDIKYILIDEYSMLGQALLGWIDKRCRQATGIQDKLFGGISFTFFGDPAQLPPVGDKTLYHSMPSGIIPEQGHLAYLTFDKVVKLSLNQRVQGTDTAQCTFRDLLMRLRTGDSTEQDWELLLTRQPSAIPNLNEFSDATRLYYSNNEVANYNYIKLLGLKQPIAHIHARHSSSLAKTLPPDEMSGLIPELVLAKNAIVMLTMNVWPEVGLCNGATGKVIDIIYAENNFPPMLPIAVVVQFDQYKGPSSISQLPISVPICPITVTSQAFDQIHERQQIPLKLAWAITIHRSQGLTLPKAWINIGSSEKTPGLTYVAISRVKTLESCVIEPMTLDRLTSIKKHHQLKYRIAEEVRLNKLSNKTCHTHQSHSIETQRC